MDRNCRPSGRLAGLFSRLRLPDFIVLALAAAVTVFCAVRIYGKSIPSLQFVIQGKEESWVYPASQASSVVVAGPLGNTIIEMNGGQARVVSSPCTNQICVASGAIRRRNQWIACLPNAVFVRMEAFGEKQTNRAEPDAAVW